MHGWFAGLLAVGVVLRVLVIIGYRPAFIFPDSTGYLAVARTLVPNTQRPSGYSLLLHVLPGWDLLWPIAAVQHLLGVLIAVGLYVAVYRRGVPAWGAALAAAPVLLDPWQITLEHYVLSDVAFEALVAGALVILTWREKIGPVGCAAAGAAFGVAATVRGAGTLLAVPAVLAVLAGLGRRRLVGAVALAVAFAVPFASYLGYYHHFHGRYATSGMAARFLYGRVAPFADCSRLRLPDRERALCPARGAVAADRQPDWYVWNHESPLMTYHPPRGTSLDAALRDFDRRVILHQPLDYAAVVVTDVARGFAPTRTVPAGPSAPTTQWWILPRSYPVYGNPVVAIVMRRYDVKPHLVPSLTTPLNFYGRNVYVPGPLLAAALLCGVAATIGVGRSRWSGLRPVTGLWVGTTIVVLFTAAAVVTFSWRYQIQQLVLIPPAGALGLTALLAAARDRPRKTPRPPWGFTRTITEPAGGESRRRFTR